MDIGEGDDAVRADDARFAIVELDVGGGCLKLVCGDLLQLLGKGCTCA